MNVSVHLRVVLLAALALLAAAPSIAQGENPFVEEIGDDSLDTPLGDGLDDPIAKTPPPPKPTPKVPDARPGRDKPTGDKATGGKGTGGKAKGDRTKPGDKKGGDDASEEDAAPAELAEGIEVIQLSFDGVLERWDARRKALETGDPAARIRAASSFEEGLRNYGAQGVAGGLQAVDFAAALIEESRRARDAGESAVAIDRAEVATRTAPDLPPAFSQLAWARITGGNPGGAIDAALRWGGTVARDPASSILGLAGLLTALVFAVFAVLLLFSLVGLGRAFRYLTFDLHNALPRGAARWQVRLLVILLAALPIVVNAGPVVTVLWWLTMSFLYFSAREQLVVAVFTALLLPAPYAVDAVAKLWSFPGSRLADAYAASYDIGALKALERIALVSEKSRSLRERAAMASRIKREGELEEAYVVWRLLVQEQRDAAWAHNNLGVVAALNNREDHAVAEFEAALDRDPKAIAPAFNLSLINTRRGKPEKASKLIAAVTAIDAERVEAFRTLTFRRTDQLVSQNRAYVDMAQPADAIGDALAQRSDAAAALSREVSGVAFVGQQGEVALGLMAFFLLIWGALFRAKARLQPSHACVRCGSAASRRYDADEVPADTCSACYHTFLSSASRVEAGMKLRKEAQVMAYRRGQRRWQLLATVLWPGSGHLHGGAPARGAPMAFLFAFVLACAALALGPLPWPHLEGDLPLVVGGAIAAAILLILYPVALRSVES